MKTVWEQKDPEEFAGRHNRQKNWLNNWIIKLSESLRTQWDRDWPRALWFTKVRIGHWQIPQRLQQTTETCVCVCVCVRKDCQPGNGQKKLSDGGVIHNRGPLAWQQHVSRVTTGCASYRGTDKAKENTFQNRFHCVVYNGLMFRNKDIPVSVKWLKN